VGSRELALYLLANGAHNSIYAAAMLGQLELVKAFIAVQADAHRLPGAHGIPLLIHARQGGDAASEVLAYLESLA
jgi:hypothetical protein